MNEVPIIRKAIVRRILAHGGNGDSVSQHDILQSVLVEQARHSVAPDVISCGVSFPDFLSQGMIKLACVSAKQPEGIGWGLERSEANTNDGLLVERALDTIREFMQDDGQQFAYHKFIAPSGAVVSLSKSLNRSVTGSMNDLVQGAKFHLLEDMSPHEVGFQLNQTPLSALKDASGRRYATPREVFKRLVDTMI